MTEHIHDVRDGKVAVMTQVAHSTLAGQEMKQNDLGIAQFALPHMLTPNDVHVLLVDDERLSRMIVGNVLRKCNYRVSVAESGSQAVAQLRSSPPGTFQLVLTDVMMPDVDGIELLRFLRGNDAFAAVPVVMMSANDQNDTVFECIRGGAEDYLLKPVTRKEVQNIWQHVWRRQQQLLVPNTQEELDDTTRPPQSAPVPTVANNISFEAGNTAVASTQPRESNSNEVLPVSRDVNRNIAPDQHPGTKSACGAAQQQSVTQQQQEQCRRQQPSDNAQLQEIQQAVSPRQQAPGHVSLHHKTAVLRDECHGSKQVGGVPAATGDKSVDPVAIANKQQQNTCGNVKRLKLATGRPSTASASALPPSRPMAEFLGTAAGRNGEDSFRVLCQVLGYLRAAHAAGRALGRLRPSALRVTASRIVLLDPLTDVPPLEEALYAAPEERVDATASSGAASSPQRPRRSMAADMFSFGLLLLQLVHSVPHEPTPQLKLKSPADAAAEQNNSFPRPSSPLEISSATQQLLTDARHQVFPKALQQGRPTEVALLTALLSAEPSKRPVVDDVLRCGLLKQLHSSVTASQTRQGVAASAPSSAPPDNAMLASAHTIGRGMLLKPSPMPPPLPGSNPLLLQQALDPKAKSSPTAPCNVGLKLSDSAALQDFLRLARESVMEEAAAVNQQIKALTTDANIVSACLTAVKSGATLNTVQPVEAAPQMLQSTGRGVKCCRQSDEDHSLSDTARQACDKATSAGVAPGPVPAQQLRQQMNFTCDSQSPPILPESPTTTMKSQRVSAALPAFEAVYFRARSLAVASGSPTRDPPATISPAVASGDLQHQPQDHATPKCDKSSAAVHLPGYLTSFGCDLDAYSRFGNFSVVANLKYGDGLAAPDMICSTSFDRDDQFFATAGASKHVKVYEYASLLEEASSGGQISGGAHYPVLDLPFRSRLSCITWNTYLKSHLLAADYDGIATLVDASTGCEVASYAEHSKRVWSVDFSTMDPQRFLSGSDDGTVRLWSLNEQSAVAVMDAKANVCSVQFSPTDANLMAFGAANYRTYLYDLRHVQSPLATVQGHSRAISYVRFLGCGRRLLTASTDNALKLWDIATLINSPRKQLVVADMTFTGHVNEKNFVGLSVTDEGYIATGSEDNTVVAYHASLSLPVARHSFSSPNRATGRGSASGRRVNHAESAHFVSSVAWARHGSTCVASNSQGHLRVLRLSQ